MNFLSVCSGIEAASVAWGPLGWRAVAFSEIEPFPCAVLAHHYPHVPNWGDMTKYKDWPDVAIDLLCGGTPCQTYSLAGLRKGLDDPRGDLMLTFGAIAAKYRPQWLVWENVFGVLSSNEGRDFASFLGLLTGQEISVPAGGWQNSGVVAGIDSAYGVAWRVLDAQYFGVAQRRRRVFVIGCLGDWRGAAAVLFERHSVSGHPAPSRQAREGSAAGTLRSTDGGSDVDHGRAGHLIPQAFGGNNTTGPIDVATAVRAHGTFHYDFESETFLAGTLQANGKAAGSATQQDAESGLLVPVAFKASHYTRGKDGAPSAIAPPLSADADKGDQDTLLLAPNQAVAGAMCAEVYSGGMGGRVGMAVQGYVQPYAFTAKDYGADAAIDLSPTLRAGGHSTSHQNGGVMPAIAYTTKLHNTASAQSGKIYEEYTVGLDSSSPPPALLTSMQVRRLTPTECERLQGFDDGYTRIPTWNGWRKMGADETPEQCLAEGMEVRQNKKTLRWSVKDVDGPRYKAIGNSWAIPNVRWIGRRIEAVDRLHRMTKGTA